MNTVMSEEFQQTKPETLKLEDIIVPIVIKKTTTIDNLVNILILDWNKTIHPYVKDCVSSYIKKGIINSKDEYLGELHKIINWSDEYKN